MRFSAHRSGFSLDVDIPFGPRERLGIIGPNGAGKSTLVDQLLRSQRSTSTVSSVRLTQHALCFPHLTVLENVAFAPRAQGHSVDDARITAQELLDRAGLSGVSTEYPTALSSGQQQQVALLRALAAGSSTLLLDEPMSFLDVQAAKEYRALVAALTEPIEQLVVITHDPRDLRALVDRVIVLDNGHLVSDQPTHEFFASPLNAFAEAFLI